MFVHTPTGRVEQGPPAQMLGSWLDRVEQKKRQLNITDGATSDGKAVILPTFMQVEESTEENTGEQLSKEKTQSGSYASGSHELSVTSLAPVQPTSYTNSVQASLPSSQQQFQLQPQIQLQPQTQVQPQMQMQPQVPLLPVQQQVQSHTQQHIPQQVQASPIPDIFMSKIPEMQSTVISFHFCHFQRVTDTNINN